MESQTFTRLLEQLRQTDSQLEQLKILVRGWKQLRDLDASEKKRLALSLGWDSAEALLDRLGEQGGIAPSHLLRAVREAERDRPGQLRKIISGLRSIEQRKAALRQGLDLAGQVVEAIGVEPSPLKPPPQPPASPPPSDQAATPPTSDGTTPERPATLSPPAEPTPTGAPTKPDGKTAPVSPVYPAKPRHPSSPEAPAAALETGPWEKLLSVSRPDGESPPTDGPEIETGQPEPAETRKLLRTFKALRNLPENTPESNLLELLKAFPDGWRRRRALSYLLAAGRISNPETVMEQIAGLSRVADRYWCASTWLDASPQPKKDLARLAALLPARWLEKLSWRSRE